VNAYMASWKQRKDGMWECCQAIIIASSEDEAMEMVLSERYAGSMTHVEVTHINEVRIFNFSGRR